MNILIVNDDGITSLGILQLAEVFSRVHTVTVVAPHTQKSGCSHSLSFHTPINFNPYPLCEGVLAYELMGTPCDCVKFGIDVLMEGAKPDVIICGINDDYNLGTDVIYSATVNAALEGAVMGYSSIAVSQGRAYAHDYIFPAEFILNNLEELISYTNNSTTCISINFPTNQKEDIAGIAITPLGMRRFNDRYDVINSTDGSGFMLLGEPMPISNPSDCDVEFSKKNYITITPVKIQTTDTAMLTRIKRKGANLCI